MITYLRTPSCWHVRATLGGVHREIRPASIAQPAANYAHAVLTEGVSRWLHTAGVVPTRPDGTVPADVGEQADTVWTNIAAMLAEAGMRPADIVSVTTYVVAGEELGPVMAARDRFLGGRRVASTLVTVPALARSEWRVEVAVVAAAA
jgi:2-iminobutanoate/2-iminopropanoate deaminase